jgi:Rrf2 family protein
MTMLALTKKTGYALIAMTHLATLKEGELSSAREMAGRYAMPAGLVANAMKTLASAGYVESVRGAQGGYRLARDPEEITLADIVEVLDRSIQLAECLGTHEVAGDVECRIRGRCPIVDPLNRVQRRLKAFLGSVKLSDLVDPAFALASCEEGALPCR